jgi:sterol 3beta-glucosyltransferase
MLNRDAAKIDYIVREALKQTNNRGIILKGWSDVKHSSSNEILYLEAVPHQWLLPLCRMIVHHGGAGTTSAGLRAGIPNIVIPHTADQPFWGSRVHAIGAGPKPIPINELSVAKLTRAMNESSGRVIHKYAQAIADKLRSEEGVSHAVSWIEKYSHDFLRNDP